MSKTPLNKLLSSQALILSYIKEKLDVLNFLNWAFERELSPVYHSSFLVSVAHIYYRSIVVETCTLFDNHKYQSNNFHLLIDSKKRFSKELSPAAKDEISKLLKLSDECLISIIVDVRNEEISHFRFSNSPKISLSLDFLPELIRLSILGDQIVRSASQGFILKENSAHYIIDTHSSDLDSLQSLLKKASGFDFRGAYSSNI